MELFSDEDVVLTEATLSIRQTGAVFRVRDISSVRVLATSSWWWLSYAGLLSIFASTYYLSYGLMCSFTHTGRSLMGFGALLFFAGVLVIWLARRLPPMRYNVLIGVGGQEINLIYSINAEWSNRLANGIRSAMTAE